MTTTVTVQARAWGAKVTTGSTTMDVEPNTEQQFHLEENDSLTVTQGDEPKDQQLPDPAGSVTRVTEDQIRAAGGDPLSRGSGKTTV